MPSNIQGLIQTIIGLRNLQLQEAAQDLQRRQQQIGAIGQFQSLAQQTSDPSQLTSIIPQYSQTTGVSADVLGTIARATPASTASTKSRAVQSGAQQLGGSQDVAAATTELTGQTPGSSARDKLIASLFGGTSDYYSNLNPEQQQGFHKGVLQGVATGQDIGSAAMSSATADFMQRAPRETRDEIVRIGKGLAPSSSEQAQLQLGYAKYRLDQRNIESSLAFEDIRTRAALMAAQAQMDKGAFKETNDLLDKKAALVESWAKNSGQGTLTPSGMEEFRQTINSYNAQLRQAAPSIFGPTGSLPLQDFPKGNAPAASDFGQYLKSQTQQH